MLEAGHNVLQTQAVSMSGSTVDGGAATGPRTADKGGPTVQPLTQEEKVLFA